MSRWSNRKMHKTRSKSAASISFFEPSAYDTSFHPLVANNYGYFNGYIVEWRKSGNTIGYELFPDQNSGPRPTRREMSDEVDQWIENQEHLARSGKPSRDWQAIWQVTS